MNANSQPSPRTRGIVPISVSIPGVGQVFFPKRLRGQEVSEAELKRLWAEYVTPHIPRSPARRKSHA